MALSGAARVALNDCFPLPIASEIASILGATSVLSGAEAAFLDSVTAGTAAASKAVVLDGSKGIATITSATITTLTSTTGNITTVNSTNVDAGASGTAGSVDVFPTTASKGKLSITAADSAGDTTTTIVNASQSGARTYTIPDAGASCSFAMLAGTQAFTGRITTTDGVTSGTARVVGGRAYSNVAASDAVTAVASNGNHVDFANTYSIPASTLGINSVTRIKGMVRVTDASGTDTLEIKLYIGGTTLLTTTAFDPDAAADFVSFEFELVSRAAAGAAASHVGMGRWVTSDGGSLVHGAAILAPTNLATNGALVVKASAKWSSNTASTSATLEILNVDII